jgi:DNA-binding transcriptional LysR family regulator
MAAVNDGSEGRVPKPTLSLRISQKLIPISTSRSSLARLLNLAQREADIAFRIVAFNTADVVQRRLIRLEYSVYIARESSDPKYGDVTGFRLITHDTSIGQFPDIARLIESFPNATPALRSNNRRVQGRMCGQGVGSPFYPAL